MKNDENKHDAFEEIIGFCVEGGFNLRNDEIKFYHRLGLRLLNLQQTFGLSDKDFLKSLIEENGRYTSVWKDSMAFAKEYPDLSKATWGKDVSWNKIKGMLKKRKTKKKTFTVKQVLNFIEKRREENNIKLETHVHNDVVEGRFEEDSFFLHYLTNEQRLEEAKK